MANSKSLIKAKEAQEIKKSLMLSDSFLKANQLLQILQSTPKEHIYRRPGKGGGEFEYVTGTYIKKVLNYVFGWQWDFEVKNHGKENKAVWVLGRLTIKDGKGNTRIIKEQFGRADIKEKKTGGELDFGNDLKSAATDALKKCASELGIASDVYGKQEFKEISRVDKGFVGSGIQNGSEASKNAKNSTIISDLPASETDKKRIVDACKKEGAESATQVASLIKKKTGKVYDWNKMTKNEASQILFKILNK